MLLVHEMRRYVQDRWAADGTGCAPWHSHAAPAKPHDLERIGKQPQIVPTGCRGHSLAVLAFLQTAQSLTAEDIWVLDYQMARLLAKPAGKEDTAMRTFSVSNCDGSVVDLVPGGYRVTVK